jgi:glycosyltransferase involved in cell wall biosynthesis
MANASLAVSQSPLAAHKPLRILYHHRTQGRGAEGNHIVSIVTALRQLGHEVDVLSPPGVDPFDPESTVPVDKANAKTRGWGSLWKVFSKHLPNALFELAEIFYNVPAFFRLRTALRAKPYDLVFERYAFYLLAGAFAARSAGCRFLLEMNEVSGIPGRARKQSLPRLCAFFERVLLKRCDVGHAVSSYLGDRAVANRLESRRVVVAPNGFDVARLKTKVDRAQMRKRLGFDDGLVIGFAGWFDHWDRLDFMVDVFAEVHRAHPNTRLCLVGDGPGLQHVRDRIAELRLQHVAVMTGAVARKDVYDYLQVFDIGLLPHSNVFGSPIIMFELMGFKIPLVLPRLPPIQDVHGAGGTTALLFEPLNRGECIANLSQLIQSEPLRRALASKAHDKLLSEHSWTATAGKILGALSASKA